ncbi:MAG TPA: M55 family metallopeptidase [Terriglobales bacterium]|nr:M55 family metallopeptidase [Terriglobales bacterium]
MKTRWALPGVALLLCAVAAGQKDRGPKVYISVDMEGVAGVVDETQTSPAGRDYAVGRRLMIAEANAAIAAAFEAGATEVVVNDSHWDQTNLLPDQVDSRATLITGAPKPFGMMQGLDNSFAAAIFIGYHARGSTADAVIDHTYSDQLKHVRLNGREVGEYGLNAALAGHYGVPVVFVSGDQALSEQAREFIPGVEVLAVKEGIGRTAARTMHPEEARKAIAAGIRTAMARRAQIAPVRLSQPVTLEVELASSRQADSCMMVPGMKRVSGRVVSYTAPDMAVAYQVSRLISRLAGS